MAVFALLTSCSKSDYKNVIPKEALCVVSVNIAEMAKKGDFSSSSFHKMAEDVISQKSLDQNMNSVKDIFKDPEKMGIDFTEPIYMFVVSNQFVCMTMKVHDEGDVDGFVDELKSQGKVSGVKEKDGLKRGLILDGISYAYNDAILLLVGSLDGSSVKTVNNVIDKFMTLKDDEMFINADEYSKFAENESSDMSAFIDYRKVFSAYLATTDKSVLTSVLKDGMLSNALDVNIYAKVNFLDGKAEMNTESVCTSEKSKKIYAEFGDNLHKIEGRYMNLFNENAYTYGCAGINGKYILDYMKKNKSALLLLLGRYIDVEQIIRQVNGDIAFNVQNVQLLNLMLGSKAGEFTFKCHVSDTKFMNDVPDWQKTLSEYGIQMRKSGDSQYCFKEGEYSIVWGLEKDDFYFSTVEAWQMNSTSSKSAILKSYEDDIKNSYVFVYSNLEKYIKNIGLENKMIFNRLSSCTYRKISTTEDSYVIELKDKKTNFLKQMIGE
ncbi:MAG: DUF4836 family protein [Bacteroidaceae bacterium]|nr:DUF4836 family protein [Bacteroidaceae bacterium]